MERHIGMDVHAASCTIAVISEKGRKLKDFPVETNGQSLVEAIRMIPGHKHLVFDEGLQSAWLFETLKPHVDDIIVAGITTSRGPKSDKGDAYALAENLDTLPVEGCDVGALEVRGLGPARGMERERDSALGQAPEFVAHPRVPPRSRSFDPGISPDASGSGCRASQEIQAKAARPKVETSTAPSRSGIQAP